MTGDLAGRFAQAAEALVGSPFRLHGRDPATGVDCVGLVLLSLQAVEISIAGAPAYTIRQIGAAIPETLIEKAGFVRAGGEVRPGDLLLTRPGPAQLHLLIAVRDQCAIHAHAGLGRVVATPMPLPWPIVRKWRFSELE